MGQDAFVKRYDKPNHRLHIVVFIAIVAVSIFLASQVEKTKDKADVAAFKNPVPIDSIKIAKSDAAPNNVPSIKTPVINKDLSSASTTDLDSDKNTTQEQEYAFDDQPNLESIKSLLNPEQAALHDDSTTEDATIHSKGDALEVENELNPDPGPDLMDQAYQQQQDRFLETLAKSAELESHDSFDITKLKEAMRADKPLVSSKKNSASTVVAKPSTNNSLNVKPKNIEQAQDSGKVKTTFPKPRVAKSKLKSTRKQDLQQASLKSTKNIASTNKNENSIMTRGELNSVVSQFARSYNKGDINQLMALFTDNAHTNDQKNKNGIKADYAELFSNTKTRNLMIKDIKWHLANGKAEGAAAFVVTVQPKNSVERNFYKGYIKITAIKQPKGVYITRLIHELNK